MDWQERFEILTNDHTLPYMHTIKQIQDAYLNDTMNAHAVHKSLIEISIDRHTADRYLFHWLLKRLSE